MTSLLLAEAAGTTFDYVVIATYFVGILAFGSFFGRFSKSTRDFFFSGQKFAWWLIAMSMVATGVGSYSFIKYSAMGFKYGMSSSMTYMNDWFFIPFFMFGWLPIIYFSRCRSIPEYFQRRFDTKCRIMAAVIMLMYMVGYVGVNLFTLGVAANKVLGVDLYSAMIVIACVSAIYITAGGQTAVIFTDLLQGFMLLFAGLLLFVLGLDYLGMDGGLVDGFRSLWAHIAWHGPGDEALRNLQGRLPLARFNEPPDFNFVGIFWQDGVANSITFLFINQGLIMRFLAAKSMTEGRKTILFNTLLLMPIAMVVVSNAGWIGNAMAGIGIIDENRDPEEAFVVVTELVCKPGVFGFILAALTAALMSTIDTLTNATAAIFVYDVYQPYLAKNRPDRHYLRAARCVSLGASALGLGCGFIFSKFGSIYAAHGAFTSIVTPAIVVSVAFGAFWKRYTPTAAFWSMLGGFTLIWASVKWPAMIEPFGTWLHGVSPEGGFKFMRAFFGLFASGVIGVVISLFTKPKPESEIAGLWVGSIDWGRRFFKGGEPNFEIGEKIVAQLRISEDGTAEDTAAAVVPAPDPAQTQEREGEAPLLGGASGGITQPPTPSYPVVRLSTEDMARMKARQGDLLYVADARRYLGGLRSLHAKAGRPHDQGKVALIHPGAFKAGSFVSSRPVRVEKFF